MTSDKQHIDILVAKYLTGEATPQERDEINAWTATSAENQKYVDQLRFVYQKASATPSTTPVDTQKAWQTVKAKMHTQAPEAVTLKPTALHYLLNHWWQVAAVFVLLIISVTIFQMHSGKQQEEIKYTIASAQAPINHTFGSNAHVCLNKNSTIVFKQYKNQKKKELILSGEAFIQVTHTDTQLVVKAQETLIQDIGTSFNVKAQPASPTIEVFVQEGQVSFYTSTQNGLLLHKGETGIYNKKTKTFTKTTVVNPNAVAYKTRKFVFVNTPLSQVVKQLNEAYLDAIILADPQLGNQTITVTFNNEKTTSIVDVMSATLGLKASKTPKGYMLHASSDEADN